MIAIIPGRTKTSAAHGAAALLPFHDSVHHRRSMFAVQSESAGCTANSPCRLCGWSLAATRRCALQSDSSAIRWPLKRPWPLSSACVSHAAVLALSLADSWRACPAVRCHFAGVQRTSAAAS